MSLSKRTAGLAGLGLLLCLSAGCVDVHETGDLVVWKYAAWVPLSMVLGGILMVPAGWMLREKTNYAWALLIGSPILALVMGPGMFTERVTVDADHFTLNVGFWFAPNQFDVRFDDLQRIDITSETSRGRRGRKRTNYFLDCYNKSGGMDHVPVGTLMEEAAPAILAVAEQRGIRVSNLTD